MKTALKAISIILKVATIIMAIIGTIMSIYILMIGKTYVNHIYDVIEECDPLALDPDDDAQDAALTTEAISRALADPKLNGNKFINVVSHSVNRIASFVANL